MILTYEHYGQDVPEGLIGPKLHDIELVYWRAYRELSTERQAGMVAGPIPWSVIQQYAELNCIIGTEAFLLLMREMDAVYLEYQASDSSGSAK